MFQIFAKKQTKNILNNRGTRYIGRVATVIRSIENGYGKAKVYDDSIWTVVGNDCPANSLVEVVSVVDSMILVVTSISPIPR